VHIWGGVLFIIIIGMFLLFGRIWCYVYLQRCHSFVIFVHLNCICGTVQVYLVIGLSFQCVVLNSVRSIVLYVCPNIQICNENRIIITFVFMTANMDPN
jgi:hypothetical protein